MRHLRASKILFILILLFISGPSAGQTEKYKAEEFEAALLQAKYGALLVYNGQTNSFTLRFESTAVEPTEQPNFLRVDGLLLQSSITPFTVKLNFQSMDEEAMKQYLLAWKAYEKKWVEEQLKQEVTEKHEFIQISNRPFLYWMYDMPKKHREGNVEKQVFVVTICFDQMLILNGPVVAGEKESNLRDKLLAIAKTVTLYPNQTQDVQKLYNELKK